MVDAGAERARGSPAPVWARVALAAAFAWYAVRLLAFAIWSDPSLPPDETTHFGRVLAFARTWGIPSSGPDDYGLGLLSHRPFLYSWTLARLTSLGLDSLLALRLVNVGLALATAGFGLAFIRIVSREPRTHLLFVVLLTNTLMLTALGGSVHYDNGANLLAAASFYLWARWRRDGDPGSLAMLLLCLGLGCLTKRSFLPLAAILSVALLWRAWRSGRTPRELLRARRALWAAVALVAVANAVLYGGNWLRFGRLVPGFDQVVGTEAALGHRIFAREHLLEAYREGRMRYGDALAAAGRIRHAADRESARALLSATRERMRLEGDARLPLHAYALVWVRLMFERSVGYFGHRVWVPPDWQRWAIGALLLAALACHLERWRQPASREARAGAAIALVYAGVVLLLVNHPSYLTSGLPDAGVQGRYLFPVWIPATAFVAVALSEDAPAPLRRPLCALSAALALWSDAPSLLLLAGPHWLATH